MARIASEIMSWLELEKGVHVSEEWLQACVQWILNEDVVNAGASIRPLIYEQLLHADLRDTVRKSCFDRVNFLDAGDITGNFLVQIISVIDVSCSSKLQRIKDRSKMPSSTNRLLLLDITDGVIELKAMEYNQITTFNLNLEPGTKILLRGKIRYNLNILLLCHDNVHILGGTISDLTESTSMLHQSRCPDMKHNFSPKSANNFDEKSVNLQDAIFLDHFSQLSTTFQKHTFVIVKGHFVSVVDEISHESGIWVVTLLIEDEYGSKLKVLLSNEIIEKLIGLTAKYFAQHISPGVNHDLHLKEKAGKGFAYFQSFIYNLNCFFILAWNSVQNIPVVIRLLDTL